MRRDLNMRPLAVRTNISVIFGGIVGVVFAFIFRNVWALVAQQLATSACDVLVLWWYSDWRPKFRFAWWAAKDLLSFSIGSSLASLGVFVNGRADVLITGLFFGGVAVGLYRFASRLVDTVVSVTVTSLQGASLPELSRYQDNPARFRERMKSVLRAERAPVVAAPRRARRRGRPADGGGGPPVGGGRRPADDPHDHGRGAGRDDAARPDPPGPRPHPALRRAVVVQRRPERPVVRHRRRDAVRRRDRHPGRGHVVVAGDPLRASCSSRSTCACSTGSPRSRSARSLATSAPSFFAALASFGDRFRHRHRARRPGAGARPPGGDRVGQRGRRWRRCSTLSTRTCGPRSAASWRATGSAGSRRRRTPPLLGHGQGRRMGSGPGGRSGDDGGGRAGAAPYGHAGPAQRAGADPSRRGAARVRRQALVAARRRRAS